LLDNRPLAENLSVSGLGPSGSLWAGISGQTDRLGERYRIEVSEFRIFRRRATKQGKEKF
ncbi:MAG: hypothetical protein JXP34_04310, partial [Planctomycetes bacterium]|nr:hypothetical protein [Planctomycetota bacterium]